MGPVTENRVSDIVVVGDLNRVEDNRVFNLGRVPDNTFVSDKGRTADKSRWANFGIFADNGRA